MHEWLVNIHLCLLFQETQIQKVMDTAGEIGGNVRVVKQPRITTKKKNNRMVEGQKANSGQFEIT